MRVGQDSGTGDKIELHNLISGESLPVANGDFGSTFGFAPDSKWSLVYAAKSTFGQQEDGENSTLYLVRSESGAIQEITGVGESDDLDFEFSDDSKWAFAFSTRRTEIAFEDERTLYVINAEDGSAREIDGRVMNAFFSPASTQIAYTIVKEDGTPHIYLTDLDSGDVHPVGPGVVTGWYSIG